MKYGAKPTTIDGIRFASKREAERYCQLKLELKCGSVKNLILQPKFVIYIDSIKICTVILDFQYQHGDLMVYEDVKGFDTPISKLKRRMVEAAYKIKVTVVK
jgi:hypothetical protein